jgi:hypothetical protein
MDDAVMDFGSAFAALKAEKRVTRQGWDGANRWLSYHNEPTHTAAKAAFIYLIGVEDNPVLWLPVQPDILAQDWVILAEAAAVAL